MSDEPHAQDIPDVLPVDTEYTSIDARYLAPIIQAISKRYAVFGKNVPTELFSVRKKMPITVDHVLGKVQKALLYIAQFYFTKEFMEGATECLETYSYEKVREVAPYVTKELPGPFDNSFSDSVKEKVKNFYDDAKKLLKLLVYAAPQKSLRRRVAMSDVSTGETTEYVEVPDDDILTVHSTHVVIRDEASFKAGAIDDPSTPEDEGENPNTCYRSHRADMWIDTDAGAPFGYEIDDIDYFVINSSPFKAKAFVKFYMSDPSGNYFNEYGSYFSRYDDIPEDEAEAASQHCNYDPYDPYGGGSAAYSEGCAPELIKEGTSTFHSITHEDEFGSYYAGNLFSVDTLDKFGYLSKIVSETWPTYFYYLDGVRFNFVEPLSESQRIEDESLYRNIAKYNGVDFFLNKEYTYNGDDVWGTGIGGIVDKRTSECQSKLLQSMFLSWWSDSIMDLLKPNEYTSTSRTSEAQGFALRNKVEYYKQQSIVNENRTIVQTPYELSTIAPHECFSISSKINSIFNVGQYSKDTKAFVDKTTGPVKNATFVWRCVKRTWYGDYYCCHEIDETVINSANANVSTIFILCYNFQDDFQN